MEKPQRELYNIVWIWYWCIFIIEPALNCVFFSFDVLQMKQTHKTKKQNLETTKEMHREIPIPVFWIRLKINYLQYPVFNSIYQTWWILDKRKRQETLYYCRYHGCCFSICLEILECFPILGIWWTSGVKEGNSLKIFLTFTSVIRNGQMKANSHLPCSKKIPSRK